MNVDWRTKGLWLPGAAQSAEQFAAARHSLFGGAFTWPVMVARRTAIAHNIGTLAAYCARHGLAFAPHGKTTMAPSLFTAQLRAGAWAISAATANQALAMRRLGVPRVLLANELLDAGPLRWFAEEVGRGFEFLCYVDSAEGVAAASAAARGGTRPLRVLVELGHAGGRTGCRTVAELAAVARAAAAAPGVELAGVAGYEGGLSTVEDAAAYLTELRAATLELAAAGLLGAEVIVTAGGSRYLDLVPAHLGGAWLPGRTLRTVLRSGAYVSHDDGIYRGWNPFRRVPGEGSLEAALEVWAQVVSVPQDGLAIVGMGKRDVPHDEGLPVARRVRRADGTPAPAHGIEVLRLNDHHAYLGLTAGTPLRPGDLLGFGVSHPCTAFDRWRTVPVVEDDDTVSDLIETYF
ncbi:amino acid deaminase [Virgisporangium aliadipatigenens]|uniref:Amino acid deaminase n=1 Tax=Virgisporangium aliadipatigenens TaxID=741659 RepID=A0A8J3YJV3_9ACTN|nr:alanine racemase [Virgisporangium aliadipatigenens]GIJ45350.1 amino acid deaminase [Virgisporangium aliadipatigenens]